MALRQWTAGLLLFSCMLCGCGNARADSGESTGSAAPAGSAESVELVDAPIEDDTAEVLPLDGVVICLDPGHGITNTTAQERMSPLSQETKAAYVSGASGNSQTEEELNLAVSQLTRLELESLGATVILTRETNEATVSNIERAEIANSVEADLCIRIHADGSTDSSVHGISVLIPAGDLLGTPEIVQPSTRAASIILEEMVAATGAKDRGLSPRSDMTGFNWSEVPCILIEMGFLSNAEEDKLLATEEYRMKIAGAIASGVCRWVAGGK